MTGPERSFRAALGAFATGVVVVSARDGDGQARGITINSFASVSLDPPLVLWCLGAECERYGLFAAADAWGVSVLPAAREDLAIRFARGEGSLIDDGEIDACGGAPTLASALARFSCTTFDRRIAGDHLIIVGEVQSFASTSGHALTFYRGRFASALDPNGDPAA